MFVRRRARRSSPSGERTILNASSAAAVSAGVDAVVKMNDRARFTSRSVNRAGPAAKPPSAPSVFDSVPTRDEMLGVLDARSEHGVCLVEHEQRTVVRTDLQEVVDRRHVAVHREHRLRHDERTSRATVTEELVEVADVAVAVDGE